MPAPPDVITLIVSPQDAVTLNYLIYGGAQLTLVLRNPRDADIVTTEAVTLSYLLDQYNIPIPVKLPYGFEPAVTELVSPLLPNENTPTPRP
jgi:pilus assembly protein CpaB